MIPLRPRPPAGLRAHALILLAVLSASAQNDALVSKSMRLMADRTHVWAFAPDGLRYSRIDLSSDPPAIRNGELDLDAGISGGIGRNASVLVYYNHRSTDSTTVGGFARVEADGKTALDTVTFLRSKDQNNAVNLAVRISALAQWGDTVVVGAGRGGIAVARPARGIVGALSADSLRFRVLREGRDEAPVQLRCALAGACRVDDVARLDTLGSAEEVVALAVDSSAADSVWLVVGTSEGLRRGLLGGQSFPKVALPGISGGIRIESLHADPRNRVLWAFSRSRWFFSDDHGRTFRVPPSPAFTAFDPAPRAVSLGDSSFISFNVSTPGLAVFLRDSLLRNEGAGDASLLLGPEDGLAVSLGRLTDPVIVRPGGGAPILAVGSTDLGLFYRGLGSGSGPAFAEWRNINSLKGLKGGLAEVLTYPTEFRGLTRDGQPEYVRIGYRLKKTGKVTITVYNYAMEKVKTLVKDARRTGGGSRSENPEEDRWDGRDRSGRLVSVGVYYILVESDQGEKGWGKAISVRGRN